MRLLYSLALYLYMPFALARLGWRGLGNPDYWSRIGERFGFGLSPRGCGEHRRTFWVHAVSVGEVQAALPLIRRLLVEHPGTTLVVTTMTPTGTDRVRATLGAEVVHRYVPYDLPGAAARFLQRIDPQLAVIVETEIWPNLIHACRVRDIPVVLANARLSERSAARYRHVRALLRRSLGEVTAIAAQTEEDARRFIDLGAAPSAVTVTGSTKFDVAISPSVTEAGQVLRRSWGVDRSVWIAASTHEGEDDVVLEAFGMVRRAVPGCLLVLVPRHPERFGRAAALARRHGYVVRLRSEGGRRYGPADVFVGDTMGELPVFYSASDVAFVGGSLVDAGGHNMVEPAALGLPVLLGPYLRNFAEIGQRLCEVEAAGIVRDAPELSSRVLAYLRDANLRHGAGERGRAFVESNRGACERVMALLESSLEPRGARPSPTSGMPEGARGPPAHRSLAVREEEEQCPPTTSAPSGSTTS